MSKKRSSLRDRLRQREKNSSHEVNKEEFSERLPIPTGPLPSITDALSYKIEEDIESEPIKKKSLFDSLFAGKLNNVNKRMLILATVIALIATFLIISYFQKFDKILTGNSKPIKTVYVKKNIPARTKITEDMLEIREIPAIYFIKDSAVDISKVIGKFTVTDLYAGEPVHTFRISEPNEVIGVQPMIPENHRAVSIRSNEASLIKPSDYVDVWASIPDLNPTRRGKIISTPVLQRALVLAVGGRIGDKNSNYNYNNAFSYSSNSQMVTLAVPENKVNLMTILEEKGNFKLVFRAPNDFSVIPEKFSAKEIEDALLGYLDPVKQPTKPPSSSKNTSPKKEDDIILEQDINKLVDLSEPSTPVYRAPVYTPPRSTYRAPVYRTPIHRAPVNTYKAPVNTYRAPTSTYKQPTPPKRVFIFQGGTHSNSNIQSSGTDK